MTIKILKAGQGDSILISFGNEVGKRKHILVDGGNNRSDYNVHLKQEVLGIQNAGEKINLLIITHTDQDHVKGIYYLLTDIEINKSIIENVWFNHFGEGLKSKNNDISFIESCKVAEEVQKHKLSRTNDIWIERIVNVDLGYCLITLLSPTKEHLFKLENKNTKNISLDISGSSSDNNLSLENLIRFNSDIFNNKLEDLDNSVENNASIAFLLESEDNRILFLGDANPKIISQNIKCYLKKKSSSVLELNYMKVSHHFSKYCTSMELMNLINCSNFIISANGKKDFLPNKLTFAKILKRDTKQDKKDQFLFNFSSVEQNLKFTDAEKIKYNFSCESENYFHGYKIELK